jgi:putative ABC transport system permease protein
MRLIIGDGMKPVLLGLACGTVAALLATRLLIHQLFGVSATDPSTFLTVTVTLATIALAACWFAARRATKIDPMEALRTD